MPATIQLYVTYQQVSVFDPNLSNPFNFWKDEHVAQGFSWRKGSVGFGTLDPEGAILIDLRSETRPVPDEGAIRAIVVPYERPKLGNVEIATIHLSHSRRDHGIAVSSWYCRRSLPILHQFS